jgi:hypothetical protein
MKTKTIFAAMMILLTGTAISGCNKWEPVNGVRGFGPMVQQTYHVHSFDGLQVDVDARVNIVQAARSSVNILVQQNIHDILEVRVINGVLIIGYKTQIWRHERMEIDIAVPELSLVSSFGSAGIRFVSPFAAGDLSLDVFGSGNINAQQLTAEHLHARINGSGKISLKGVIAKQQVSINGSGDYSAKEVMSSEAIINIFGSGNCTIHVNHKLHVAIHGSGSVFYAGNLAAVQTSVFGSGKVAKLY